jgi:3-carboxy-cis,cis-muconate cycloisomerase
MMSPTTRTLFDELFASKAMVSVFSDGARVQAILDFEAALARAESELEIIPRKSALTISARCRAELFDLASLGRAAALAGNVAIPLVKALTELVASEDPEAARAVHRGATSQDAIDTGLVLQLRAALDLFENDLVRLSEALAVLAKKHEHTALLGRTWLQAAPPVTFGLKVAGWLSAIDRHRARLHELRTRLLVLQFGGAVGTLASLGTDGLRVATKLGEELNLTVPVLPWHAHRDRVVEAATTLGLLAGSLGKIGRDISLMMQAEVGEVSEPRAKGRGGSTSMPHKHNPVSASVMLAAATRVPGLVATMLAAMPQEHERGLGGWQAEWETLPEICLLTSGALQHAIHVVAELDVDVERMQENVEATRGVVLAEYVAVALAEHVGRSSAHEILERACWRAIEERMTLRDVLLEVREVTANLSAPEIDRLCDPAAHLGLAKTWIERVLAASRGQRALKE